MTPPLEAPPWCAEGDLSDTRAQRLDHLAAPARLAGETLLQGGFQNAAHVPQVPQLAIDVEQPLFDQRLDFPARGRSASWIAEQRLHVIEREANGLGSPDEA